jgi:hypothetical protein
MLSIKSGKQDGDYQAFTIFKTQEDSQSTLFIRYSNGIQQHFNSNLGALAHTVMNQVSVSWRKFTRY